MHRRSTAASVAAVLGLLLAGCDDTGTQEPTEPVPENSMAESEMGSDPTATGMGGDATTGAEGTAPEDGEGGDVGGADTDN